MVRDYAVRYLNAARRRAPDPGADPGSAPVVGHLDDPLRQRPAEEPLARARRRAPVQLDLRPHPPDRALLQAPAPRRPDRGEADGGADLLRDPGAPRPPPAGGPEG